MAGHSFLITRLSAEHFSLSASAFFCASRSRVFTSSRRLASVAFCLWRPWTRWSDFTLSCVWREKNINFPHSSHFYTYNFLYLLDTINVLYSSYIFIDTNFFFYIFVCFIYHKFSLFFILYIYELFLFIYLLQNHGTYLGFRTNARSQMYRILRIFIDTNFFLLFLHTIIRRIHIFIDRNCFFCNFYSYYYLQKRGTPCHGIRTTNGRDHSYPRF